jgi:hypothetical protein
MRGDDTRMDCLGAVAELSGGTVDIVDPTSLESKLAALSAPVLATNVVSRAGLAWCVLCGVWCVW